MTKEIAARDNLTSRCQKGCTALKKERSSDLGKGFESRTGEYIVICISGIAIILSLAFFLYGIAKGFWPGNDTAFSFYSLATSLSGIVLLLGYLGSLNLFYFRLIRLNQRFRIIKDKAQVTNKAGFSLLELLITLAIMGILAVIAIPAYSKYMVKSRQADAKTQLTAVRQAQETYKMQYGTYGCSTSALSGWQSTVGRYAFSLPSCSSSNFTARASWTDGTEKDAWTMDDSGTLSHPVNSFQIE